ncbi:outer membrane protein OmpW, partial [Klebsiella pneumoniae]|nr:outer membrane protein OmpW [Klebsiella pneumoniae]
SNKKYMNETGRAAELSGLSQKGSWVAAGPVGLDYLINRDWLLNMSVWYMDIDTDVKFKAGGVDQKVSTRLDPWVFMFSAGYRF